MALKHHSPNFLPFHLSQSSHSETPSQYKILEPNPGFLRKKKNTTMKYCYTLTPSTLGTQSLRSAETQYVLAQREIQLSPSCPFHSQGKGRAWCDRVGRRKGAVLGSSGRQAPGLGFGWLVSVAQLAAARAIRSSRALS